MTCENCMKLKRQCPCSFLEAHPHCCVQAACVLPCCKEPLSCLTQQLAPSAQHRAHFHSNVSHYVLFSYSQRMPVTPKLDRKRNLDSVLSKQSGMWAILLPNQMAKHYVYYTRHYRCAIKKHISKLSTHHSISSSPESKSEQLENLFIFTLGHALRLLGSQFPDQRLNPRPWQ